MVKDDDAKVRISEQKAKFYLDFFKREYIMNPKSFLSNFWGSLQNDILYIIL